MKDFVIAAAQAASVRSDPEGNIAAHLRLAGKAAALGARLVVFPELSLTGYELDLAHALQFDSDDPMLMPLRNAASAHDMHLLVGGPLVSGLDRPYLGAFLLSPGECVCYAKMHVHESEARHVVPGKTGCVVTIDRVPVGVAICADTSHASHAADAAAHGAELYVASVMKTRTEYPAHAQRLQSYAVRHRMAVLTANYAGSTGGVESGGKSAIWDQRGTLVAQAGEEGEALVLARREHGLWRGEVVADIA